MIRTAVILTARKELGGMPFPLRKFDGDLSLIDRTLSILTGLNFEKIYIVVGYNAQMFERYRGENVHIVLNPEYEFTASMGSLYKVKDLIDGDFILIEGDTFYEKRVVEYLATTHHRNCLAITEESGSGDEAFVETRQGFISKISKDKHQICTYEGELLGIMKIGYDTFRKMVQKWEGCKNPYLNYEYLFFDCTDIIERPCVKFSGLIWGDVDCEEDFVRLKNYIYPRLRRKEDPFDRENLIMHIQAIFPNRNMSDVQISQIGGMSNKNFKVQLGDEQYVLRVPGYGSDGMVDRGNEERNSIYACELGVNPEIKYFNPQTGIKLATFIPNAETLNSATIQRPPMLDQIATIMRTVHGSQIRFNNDFNVFAEILKYEQLLVSAGGKMYDGYLDIRNFIKSLEIRLNQLGVQLHPCHNDLVPENFIMATDGTLFLIDWEYSGMNDPIWDIAAMFLESQFTENSRNYFLRKYYDGEVPAGVKEKLLIYEILIDTLWSIWTCVKEAKGDDFGSYGLDRYNRAINNIRKYKEQRYE